MKSVKNKSAGGVPPSVVERTVPLAESTDRLPWLDVSRSLAILLVVLIHATQAVFPRNEFGLFAGSFFYSFTSVIGRLGVPLFLLMTGWLVLAKKFETASDVLQFYRKNLLGLLLTIEVWILFLFLTRYCFGRGADLLTLIRQMLFLEAVPGGFWWYIPTIIPLYIMVPFISIVLRAVSPLVVAIPVGFVVLCGIVPRALSVLGVLLGIESLKVSSTLSITYAMGVYGLYMVLGFYCREYWGRSERVKSSWFALALLACILVSFLISYSGKVDLWYSDLSIFIAGTSLFILLRRAFEGVGSPRFLRATEFISKTSFAVYFLHAVVLEQVALSAVALPFRYSINATWAFAVAMAVTYSLVGLGWIALEHFPRARKAAFHA